jgi:hypothetical protein
MSVRCKDKKAEELMMKYKANIAKNLAHEFKEILVSNENKMS